MVDLVMCRHEAGASLVCVAKNYTRASNHAERYTGISAKKSPGGRRGFLLTNAQGRGVRVQGGTKLLLAANCEQTI